MSTPALEAFLARLYTDESTLAAFLCAPCDTARAAGLDSDTIRALCALDREALVMAAHSFRAKRTSRVMPCDAPHLRRAQRRRRWVGDVVALVRFTWWKWPKPRQS